MIRINGYAIDAAIRENASLPSEVTRFPVEEGSDTTDHVRNEPDTYTIEGIISNAPFGEMETERAKESTATGLLDFTPSEDARARFEKWRNDKKPIIVVSGSRTYINMVITDLSFDEDDQTGDALAFSMTLQQITFVATERTTVRVAVPIGKGKDNLGDRLGLKGAERIWVFTIFDGDHLENEVPLIALGVLKPTLRGTSNGRKASFYATFPGSPPADGYVDAKGFHSLFKVEQAEYNHETGIWTNARGDIVKVTPYESDSRINKQKQVDAIEKAWGETFWIDKADVDQTGNAPAKVRPLIWRPR